MDARCLINSVLVHQAEHTTIQRAEPVPLMMKEQSVSVAPLMTLIVQRYITYALLRADVRRPVSVFLKLETDRIVIITISSNVTVMMITPLLQSWDQGNKTYSTMVAVRTPRYTVPVKNTSMHLHSSRASSSCTESKSTRGRCRFIP